MKNKKKGFTLVELLAVIVILAIILVIAVPQIMNVIKDTTKASLESSAKMVAAQAENQYTVAQTLGKEFSDTGSCMQDWAGLNETDYASCTYEIVDGNATISIEGDGKFKGLYICFGSKTSATVQDEPCIQETPSEYFDYETVYYVKPGSNCLDALLEISVTEDNAVAMCNGGVSDGENLSLYLNRLISEGFTTIEEAKNYNVVTDVEEVIEITGYDDSNVSEITIPRKIDNKPVYGIGQSAFKGSVITEINFPNTLRYIANDAIYGSNSNDIYAPDVGASLTGLLDLSKLVNLEIIGHSAFKSNGITEIKLPASITYIGGESFMSNQISGELDLSNLTNLTTIDESSFQDNQITSVKLPTSITEIGLYAFNKTDESNKNLTTIVNSSGKTFDWQKITNQGSSATCTFATGTCGTITIKAS